MYQIDNPTAATSQPASTAPGTPGYFTDGSVGGGLPATILPAEWCNAVMLELCNAITSQGIALSKSSFNQLAQALTRAGTGRLLNIQVFNTSGTYTPTSGTSKIIVEGVGGGAGGGGCSATSASQQATGGGGGSGCYAKALFTGGFSGGLSVTIGAGGNGGATGANAGASGGTTSLGTIFSLPGGVGGSAGTPSSTTTGVFSVGSSTGQPTITGGQTLAIKVGIAKAPALVMSLSAVLGGAGGDSPFGIGGGPGQPSGGNGSPGVNSGAGGGGSTQIPSESGGSGGNGHGGNGH